MANYLTSTLITQLKIDSFYPPGLQDSDFLDFLNRALQKKVFTLIREAAEGYFLKYIDQTYNSNGLLVPARAGFGQLKEIKGSSGTISNVSQLYDIPRLEIGEMEQYRGMGFWMEGDRLMIVPQNFTGVIRMYYFHRPSEMVQEAECAKISSIDTTNKKVTVSNVPTGITTATLADFVQGKPPFSPLGIDLTITDITSSTYTLSAALPNGLAVGDYLCLAQESPVPMIPFEAFDLLIYEAANMLVKDPGHKQLVMADLAPERKRVLKVLQPRVDAAPHILGPTGIISRAGRRNWIQ